MERISNGSGRKIQKYILGRLSSSGTVPTYRTGRPSTKPAYERTDRPSGSVGSDWVCEVFIREVPADEKRVKFSMFFMIVHAVSSKLRDAGIVPEPQKNTIPKPQKHQKVNKSTEFPTFLLNNN